MNRPSPSPSHSRATLLVLASTLCFGSIAIFTIIARREGAPLIAVLAWRYALAALLLTLVAGGIRHLRIPRARALTLLAIGGLGQTLVAFLALSALDYLSAATNAFLFYTYPVWVTIIAAVRRTDSLDARRLIALAVSLAGIVTLVGTPWTQPMPARGVLLVLSAAITYALYLIALNRWQRDLPAAVLAVYISAGAALILLSGGLGTGTLTIRLTPVAWLAIAGFAIVSTTLAFVLLLKGMAVLGPVRTAIISTVEPFFTAVLGALVLAQPLRWTTLAGGALIAVAVVVLTAGKREERAVGSGQ